MHIRKTVLTLLALAVLSLASVAQTVPHKVTLTWTPSTSACVTAVNIHKSTTPGGETPVGTTGSNFGTVLVGAAAFTDNTVVAGQTYYWTVSAWGSTCGGTLHESVMSAEVKIIVPADPLPAPAPPTNLNGTVQ